MSDTARLPDSAPGSVPGSSAAAAARWVLVTGGARRLGRELCLAFARQGWQVACHYHQSADDAEAVVAQIAAAGGHAVAVAGALHSEADARELFARVLAQTGGRLDCVVNNASLFEPDTAADFAEEALWAQMRTNLVVPVTLARLLHGLHADGPAGAPAASVVHVLDQKVFNLNPDYYSYTLSKLALERSVAQQAQALAPQVRVNAVAPGLLFQSGPQTAENFAAASHANLLRHPIDPAQVAQAAAFLAGNPCITGMSLSVDNGQHLVPTERDIMFVAERVLQGAASAADGGRP
ncbi:SDR family oxidoreductase [Paracidovorax wautersii]|uniref:SDR family oxidoreductase n=1 Tax=Paracidovorax wautersii TaxID=1177982 RepID=UPI0031DCF596